MALALLLLSSRENHPHLLPPSFIAAKSPNGLIPFSLQKHYILIVENVEGWVWCLDKGEQSRPGFCLAKCVVQLKGTCNHLGDQVCYASWLPGRFHHLDAR